MATIRIWIFPDASTIIIIIIITIRISRLVKRDG